VTFNAVSNTFNPRGTVDQWRDLTYVPQRQEDANAQPAADVHNATPTDSLLAVTNQHAVPLSQRIKQDQQIDLVHDEVSRAGDTQAQLKKLNEQYTALPAPLQTKLLADPRTQTLLDAAARYANEPLSEVSTDPKNPDIEPHTNLAITRLESLTQGLDANIAAGVVRSALPAYETIQQQAVGYPVLGFNGTQMAIRLADNVWRAPGGSGLVSRLVDLGTSNINSIAVPLYEGTGPAYLLELGRRGASLPGDVSMFEYALSGVEQFANGQLTEPAQDYFEHLDELSYLTQNGGAAMTPQQLDEAVRAYMAEKGPDWENRLNDVRTQLKDSGTALLDQIQQLQDGLNQVPADQRGELQNRITELLKKPEAQLAVTMALNDNPQLVQGTRGNELAATFVELGIVGHEQPLAVTFVAAYLRENVMGPSAAIDLSDPASLGLVRSQLEQALRDNGALASMLKVTPQQMNEIADTLINLVPSSDSPLDAFEHANNVARNTNNALDKLDDSLGRSTPFNLAFRTSAVAIVGTGLVGSIQRYGDDPRLRNAVDLVLESARVGVDGAQLFATLRSWPEGTAVSGLQMAGRFVHVLGATMAGADGLNRLGQGDYVGAGLSLAVAGGVTWGALGSSAVAGPVGFGVAAVATVGLWIYDGIRSSAHNSRFEGQTTSNFLKHANLDADAARELADQSGDGYSVVPLLLRYGELRGMDSQQTVVWINEIDPTRLGALRDSLHRTLDEIDGDVARFQATDAADAFQVRDTQQRPWFAVSGDARPMSAAQMDAILNVLQIRRP
jgi:hypothetical protein